MERQSRQRKCSCDKPIQTAGKCNDCQRKSLVTQRSFNDRTASHPKPPILHETLAKPLPRRIATSNHSELSLQGSPAATQSGNSTEQGDPEKRPKSFDAPGVSAKEMGVRFAKNKAACVLPNSFAITMATHQNDETAATGLLQIEFKGRGKTRYPSGMQELFSFGKRQFNADEKVCDCDCMMYRQYLRGIAAKRLPGQSQYTPIGQITSGNKVIPADQQWHSEDTSTIQGLSPTGCDLDYEDHPGVYKGAEAGIGVLLRYNFLLQIWDSCQQKAVKESHQTLTIAGDTPPRWIHWDFGLKPLNINNIQQELNAQTQAPGMITGGEASAVENEKSV
ncbi:MAG: hypothetical protein AAFR58_18015 [Cyanobacteria bacterium J06627_28]